MAKFLSSMFRTRKTKAKLSLFFPIDFWIMGL